MSTTEEVEEATKKSKTTTEESSSGTIIIVFLLIGLICCCCLVVAAYCIYKRKREKQLEQISAGVPAEAPNQLNAQPAVSPVVVGGQANVLVVKI
ncbi:unnamed protein product [Caenorhabditis brenneri]